MEAHVAHISRFLVHVIELLALAIIVAGLLLATISAIRLRLRSGDWLATFDEIRKNIGRTLLLGLEFLLAAEIIRSIQVGETLEAVTVLGLIVLIRTFLSISIEMEIHGRWPWRRSQEMQELTKPQVTQK